MAVKGVRELIRDNYNNLTWSRETTFRLKLCPNKQVQDYLDDTKVVTYLNLLLCILIPFDPV